MESDVHSTANLPWLSTSNKVFFTSLVAPGSVFLSLSSWALGKNEEELVLRGLEADRWKETGRNPSCAVS